MTTPTIALPDWRDLAACRGIDPNVFFVEQHEDHRPALVVCRACPVRLECAADSLAIEVQHQGLAHGVFGGLAPTARVKLIRRWKRGALL